MNPNVITEACIPAEPQDHFKVQGSFHEAESC